MPPMKMGIVEPSDRYMPTATGSAATPHSSSAIAIITPVMMSAHWSVPPKIPLMMLANSPGCGASEKSFGASLPASSFSFRRLIGTSARYTGLPFSFTR